MDQRISWWTQTIFVAIVAIGSAGTVARYLAIRFRAKRYLKKLGLDVRVVQQRNRVDVEVTSTTGEALVSQDERTVLPGDVERDESR